MRFQCASKAQQHYVQFYGQSMNSEIMECDRSNGMGINGQQDKVNVSTTMKYFRFTTDEDRLCFAF